MTNVQDSVFQLFQRVENKVISWIILIYSTLLYVQYFKIIQEKNIIFGSK